MNTSSGLKAAGVVNNVVMVVSNALCRIIRRLLKILKIDVEFVLSDVLMAELRRCLNLYLRRWCNL